MAKPRLIILVRHGQSEGNKNRDVHQTIPDHRVKLTPEGVAQAHDAGRRLRDMLRPDDKLQFFTSPYRRTRETTEGILSALTSDDPEPSPFRISNIKVYEEPRLREQDFGNFQPCSAEMERMWQERADYGHFFYRIPNGESAADAYDRISGFNESLWRQFGEDDFASVCVLVTHGLMSRVFLMKWYHFTVEYFEDLRNINHCEFLIMRRQDHGKYFLETKLRTWSELRREKALKDKVKDDSAKDDKDNAKLERNKTYVSVRRWGGCPDGCNHKSHYKKREDLELMRQKDVEHGGPTPYGSSRSTPSTPATRRQRQHHFISSDEDGDVEDDDSGHAHPSNGHKPTPEIDVTRTVEETISSTDGASSFNLNRDQTRRMKSPHLHVGRDFGGTYSGHASLASSDAEASEDETHRRQRVASLNARLRSPTSRSSHSYQSSDDQTHLMERLVHRVRHEEFERPDESADEAAMRRHGVRTNRLGDMASPGEEGTIEFTPPEDDLEKAEEEDRSILGSVY